MKFTAWVVLGLMLAVALIEWRIPGALPWMLLGVGLYCVAYWILLARQRATAFDPAPDGYDVELGSDCIIQRSKIAEHSWSWAAVRRVEELPDALFLQFAGSDWMVFPNHLWPNADERSYFAKQLRQAAPNAAKPLKWAGISIPVLLIAGGVAAGLNAAIVSHGLLYLLGFDLCSCAVRQSPLGRAVSFALAIGGIILIPYAMLGLENLRRHRPRLSSAIATALILPQALFGFWVALRFLRFA